MAYSQLSAQSTCDISGKVTDYNTGMPIEGASISLQNTIIGEFTDSIGNFSLCHLGPRTYILLVDYIGYNSDTISIDLKKSKTVLDIRLRRKDFTLNEVIVKVEKNIDRTSIDKSNTDPIKILASIPGVATMNIGGNVSKPVIRGLNFNRVAVINRGIAQQNQQWGADHGLDINFLDMESANIYKGPNTLLLGSASMSAIEIIPYGFKNNKDFISGEAIFMGASNNDLFGGGLTTEIQQNKWYGRITYNYQNYGDYRIPAREISHGDENIELPDKRLPNSAGRGQTLSATLGYREKNVTSYMNISNSYQKTGLFELEHEHDEEHEHGEHEHEHETTDNSHRNIGMPYSTANHFTVTNNTEWKKSSSTALLVNTGFQYNRRKEFEHFHAHYNGQPEPSTNDNLAVDFKLKTYSTNARLYLDKDKKWKKTIGANFEYIQNKIGGYEYFLPRYNQASGGLSFINGYEVSPKWFMEAGIRYDLGHMNITGFYDNTLDEYLSGEGYDQQTVQQYAQRAYDVNRTFNSWSGSIGSSYHFNKFTLKMQLGKSFRFPSANELAANGVHHAAFRYEIGDPDLKAEHGYTFDLGIHYNNPQKLTIDFSPFISYYYNFIYLKPVTDNPVMLYDEQPYKYSQAKTLSAGGEYKVVWKNIKKLELSSAGSLVLNRNLDEHEYLPFTPPFTMTNEIKYLDENRIGRKISHYQISLSHQWYARQNRVVVGEERTPGTSLFNLSAGLVYRFSKKWSTDINIQVQNIFNTRYLNHMSLYRRLSIPEAGRNIQIFIRIPFYG